MLSDVKLGHFEVITPQQYNGYPWCHGQTDTDCDRHYQVIFDIIINLSLHTY